jgi:hypothetical protein
MSDEEILRHIKTQTLTLIEIVTANPKPSYAIDGQSVAWADYLAQLKATVEWCNRQLNLEEPFEIHSQGYTG